MTYDQIHPLLCHGGKRARREAWNQSEWVCMEWNADGTRRLRKSNGAQLQNWSPANEDIFATDWVTVEA